MSSLAADRVVDQTGFPCVLHRPARRIVSLVPSQTALLFDLGLDQQVVGVTRFCIHPAKARSFCTVVGGTKNPDIALIRKLQPDLILGNKEENDRQTIEALREIFPVWLSDVVSLEDAYAMIRAVGLITDTAPRAAELNTRLRAAFSRMPDFGSLGVIYLIWRNPYMAAGQGTFINSLLREAGLMNRVMQPRYPQVSLPELRHLQPQVIFLSSEPYPFSEKHLAEIRAAVPGVHVRLVAGEMFSWYGSRMLAAPAYFQELYAALMPTAVRSSQKEG